MASASNELRLLLCNCVEQILLRILSEFELTLQCHIMIGFTFSYSRNVFSEKSDNIVVWCLRN